ncbi:MAG TPA: hypothetical protein VEN81_07850 [Planctomycetota bacterium]|nr:hypothetical protein [Planctomycetota bacterium]
MRTSVLFVAIGAVAAMTPRPGVPGSAAQTPSSRTEGELRSRFLFLAVFEGLWEDGADPGVIQAILQKRWDHFIPKCPICHPVSHAFGLYAKSEDVELYPSRGKGLPKELQDGLRSPERKERLTAILKLVERYVSRRFAQTKMSDEERTNMRQWLWMGRKEGLSMKGGGFGDFCPSCSGATDGSK